MANSVIHDSFRDTVNCAWREVHKMEMAAIEDILRHHIENPIEGELTREKVKRAGVRCVVYDETMNGEVAADTKWKDGNLYVEVQSAFLGIAQGDWLIGPHGIRRRLTEKEEAFLSKLEQEEWMEEMGFKQEKRIMRTFKAKITEKDGKVVTPEYMADDDFWRWHEPKQFLTEFWGLKDSDVVSYEIFEVIDEKEVAI